MVLSEDLVELFKAKMSEAVKAATPEALKPAPESEVLWVTALALLSLKSLSLSNT